MGEPYKFLAIKKLKRLARGELDCIPCESARCDQDAAISPLGRHHPEQFADALDRDLPVQPVLALDDHPFTAADKLEIDTTIGLGSPALPHRIALLAVRFANEEFKVHPAHLPERTNPGGPREK